MGMPEITQETPIKRSTAITDLIETIALGEAALAHIINAEGEKIQSVIRGGCIDDDFKVNESVTKTLKVISNLEILFNFKMDAAAKLDDGCAEPPTCPEPKRSKGY